MSDDGHGAGRQGSDALRTAQQIAARREGFVEILGGIPVGAPVIVEGLVRLRDGQAIKVPGPPSTPSGGKTKEQGAR